MRRLLLAVFAIACISVASGIATQRAHADVLTIDIFGKGSGSLNGSAFTNKNFDFSISATTTGANTATVTSATFTLFGFPQVNITLPLEIGLNLGSQYAYLGGLGLGSTSNDLLRLFFSSTDFATLQNSNVFFAAALSTLFPNFVNVSTTGGPLTLTSGSASMLLVASGEVGAVPELSTWMMILIGFAAVGFLSYRRSRRAVAPVALACTAIR